MVRLTKATYRPLTKQTSYMIATRIFTYKLIYGTPGRSLALGQKTSLEISYKRPRPSLRSAGQA